MRLCYLSAIDDYRAGKAFMLKRFSPWHAVAEASRRETFARLTEKIERAPATLAVR